MRMNRLKLHTRRGFSLLELTIVIAIMGALMAIVAVNVFGSGNRAKIKSTTLGLRNIKGYIEAYQVEQSSFPTSLQTLVDMKMCEKSNTKDTWGKDLVYASSSRREGQPYVLISTGPDGLPNTPDDINLWDVIDR